MKILQILYMPRTQAVRSICHITLRADVLCSADLCPMDCCEKFINFVRHMAVMLTYVFAQKQITLSLSLCIFVFTNS